MAKSRTRFKPSSLPSRISTLLHGHHFTLLTDDKPLLSIFVWKKVIPVYSANRLQRWATILLGNNFEINFCGTTEFGQADALSRLIYNHHEPDEDTGIAAISIEDDVLRQLSDAMQGIPITAADAVLNRITFYVKLSPTCRPDG
ncbi:unnamed protein product [Schistocephalus solidus]|uniref:DUF222 domain-containing protein n=1 Tax=Schistocephalus solidus TaxID=70667 RepID=A0A183T8Q1_SCHSO|nr:unnamed protein product [Schistocephalus solidus]